jgi:hypothetical protein
MSFNLFAQVTECLSHVQLSNVGFGIVILVLVALVLGASTISAHRKLSWSQSLFQGLGSLLWASPVIAVLAFVGIKVVPSFQFGAASHKVPDDKPSWHQTEFGGDVKVVRVDSFREDTSPILIDLEENPDHPLPEWVNNRVQALKSTAGSPEQEVWRITVESGVDEADWKLSEADARASLAAKASKLIEEDFRRFHPGDARLPFEQIDSQAIKNEVIVQRTFGKDSDPFTGYKAYGQVELSPNVREELSGLWKTEVAMKRAELLAGVLGLLTLFAGAFAAYFHLDKKTNGNYRFRLKLAATALMTAGGLGLLAVLSHLA